MDTKRLVIMSLAAFTNTMIHLVPFFILIIMGMSDVYRNDHYFVESSHSTPHLFTYLELEQVAAFSIQIMLQGQMP